MIRLSRLVDYAFAILCEIARKPDQMLSAAYLSKQTAISETTVMKILKLLAKANILVSHRGSKGGYKLLTAPDDIRILDVVRAIDGPLAITICSNSNNHICNFETACLAKSGWNAVNSALANTLSQFTLTHFIQPTHSPLTSFDGGSYAK